MDREQRELQNLGFCGILNQSFKLVLKWRKIFSLISVALILPLSVLFLVNYQISQAIFPKVYDNNSQTGFTFENRRSWNNNDVSASNLAGFWIFRVAYFTILLILSLLSVSAVIFTVAADFASKQISFKIVMKAAPKVWKRLAVTFFICYVIVFAYNLVAIVILVLWAAFLRDAAAGVSIAVAAILLVLYLAGLLYIAAVWHLASVVSVLEDSYGLRALKKSKSLIKGKTAVSAFLLLLIGLCFAAVEVMFGTLVAIGSVVDQLAVRILIGILAVVLLVLVILVGIVIESVMYFVCKSHHREDIDKSLLSNHLEVYVNHYIVLGQPNVQISTEARV